MQLVLSASTILIMAFWGLFAPNSMEKFFKLALHHITAQLGWFYLLLILSLLIFAGFLAFGRFAHLKLGQAHEKPAFSFLVWFAMLFAAGMGIGLVFWGVGEPLSHYIKPPPGVSAYTPEAASTAMRYSFFHWGLNAWAVYSMVALALAYFQYRHQKPATLSAVTDSLSKRRSLHLFVNVSAIVATAFGVSASLGIGALQINNGLNSVLNVPVSQVWQVGIIVCTTALFLLSSLSGLDRGIKWLSSANLILAAALAILVWFLGPTSAIMETFNTTLGSYLSDLLRMSLRSTPFQNNHWVGDWTVFYWAWWISWSPFVGLFVARISRGRTIREFILGSVLAPSLATFIWFSIFGGTALYLEIWQNIPIAQAVEKDISSALFVMLNALPLSTFLSVVAIILVTVFFVTSGDSAVLVLSMMSENGKNQPKAKIKLLWGFLLAAMAISFLFSGGIQAVQTATIVFALPFSVVIILMMISLWHALKAETALSPKSQVHRII